MFDGKDNTFWSSEGYATPNLGGLKKGVGLRLDLGQNRDVSTVKLVLPNASDVSGLRRRGPRHHGQRRRWSAPRRASPAPSR